MRYVDVPLLILIDIDVFRSKGYTNFILTSKLSAWYLIFEHPEKKHVKLLRYRYFKNEDRLSRVNVPSFVPDSKREELDRKLYEAVNRVADSKEILGGSLTECNAYYYDTPLAEKIDKILSQIGILEEIENLENKPIIEGS
jgi:hypothetical protein